MIYINTVLLNLPIQSLPHQNPTNTTAMFVSSDPFINSHGTHLLFYQGPGVITIDDGGAFARWALAQSRVPHRHSRWYTKPLDRHQFCHALWGAGTTVIMLLCCQSSCCKNGWVFLYAWMSVVSAGVKVYFIRQLSRDPQRQMRIERRSVTMVENGNCIIYFQTLF